MRMRERKVCEGVIPSRPVLGFFSPRTKSWRTCSTSVAWSSRKVRMPSRSGSRWTPWFCNSRSAKLSWGWPGGSCLLLRSQQLEIQLADAFQGVFQFVVVTQLLLDERFLFWGKTDLFGTAAGIGDCQDPDGMTEALGTGGAAGAVADRAVEQGAAEDLGGGGERGGEFGAGLGDGFMFHSTK